MYYNVSVAPCNAPYWTRKLFSWHLLTFTCKSHFQKSEFVKAKSDSAKNVRVQTVLCEVPNAAVLWGEPTLRMSMRRLHLTKFDWRLELEHLNAIKTNPPVQEVEKKDSSLKRQRPGDHTGPFDLQRWADHRGVVASPLSAADTYPITRSKDGPCPVRYELFRTQNPQHGSPIAAAHRHLPVNAACHKHAPQGTSSWATIPRSASPNAESLA